MPHNVRTLAERWHCSQQHIRNMIARGELCVFRWGHWFESSTAHHINQLFKQISHSAPWSRAYQGSYEVGSSFARTAVLRRSSICRLI